MTAVQLSSPSPPAQVVDRGSDQQALEARSQAKRKAVQAEHQREYEEAVVLLKAKVKDLEGQDMRETIQDKVGLAPSGMHSCLPSLSAHRPAERAAPGGWGCQRTLECCGTPQGLLTAVPACEHMCNPSLGPEPCRLTCCTQQRPVERPMPQSHLELQVLQACGHRDNAPKHDLSCPPAEPDVAPDAIDRLRPGLHVPAQINTWFVANRKPDTGDYPDFPDEEDGGSRLILHPPPPVPAPVAPPPDAKGAKKAPPKPAKPAKGKAKGGLPGGLPQSVLPGAHQVRPPLRQALATATGGRGIPSATPSHSLQFGLSSCNLQLHVIPSPCAVGCCLQPWLPWLSGTRTYKSDCLQWPAALRSTTHSTACCCS